jgi:hypothetical protein
MGTYTKESGAGETMLEAEAVQAYLTQRVGSPVQILQIRSLTGGKIGAAALKGIGYGRPICVEFRADDRVERMVLRQVKRDGFGHELQADRVAAIWWNYHSFGELPRHIAAQDLVALDTEGSLQSWRQVQDLVLLTDYVPGYAYADDLLRLCDEGDCTALDRERAEALAHYLAQIHAVKHQDPLLWRRRLRDLIGHGEGIMGQTDNWPLDSTLATTADLLKIEEAANQWRWRLKPLVHRLSQVHGDYHPFNIFFTTGTDFALLDRSRGEWGAPEDDVTCLAINYLFFSLQRSGRLAAPFAELYNTLWETYLGETKDDELLGTVQPWFAWRALVLANPVWYPTIRQEIRRKLLLFARRIMTEDVFDWRSVDSYLEDL